MSAAARVPVADLLHVDPAEVPRLLRPYLMDAVVAGTIRTAECLDTQLGRLSLGLVQRFMPFRLGWATPRCDPWLSPMPS